MLLWLNAHVFHPFAPFVGLRYVRARTHKFFVSFITWVSLLGVGLGVAALIVILSVMNGFEGELRDQLLTLSAHARCRRPGSRLLEGRRGASADPTRRGRCRTVCRDPGTRRTSTRHAAG